MSDPKDLDFDLESILAEFSDPGVLSAEPPKAKTPEPERPAAPAARPRTPAQEPAPARKSAAAPAHRSPAPTARPNARPAARPRPAKRTPVGVDEPTILRPAGPRPPRKPSLPRPKAAEQDRRYSPEWRRMRSLLGVIFALLSLLSLFWLAGHVRPDGGGSGAGKREDLSARLDLYAGNAVSAALGEAAIPKLYAIPETAVSAPKPDPACFGSTNDPAQVQAVIDRAADLLDGQSLAWDPNAQFFPGSDFRYYLDDSLFVLCWKEILDNKCCSFAEVKIADGSQLRRKLADDSYGSSVQVYATQMARDANAVVAINGDFYAFRNLGVTVYQRQLYRCSPASVDSCFFTADGDMVFAYAGQLKNETEVRQFLEDNDVVFSLAFGPVLIDNGQLKEVPASYPIGEVDHYYSRSCIGMRDRQHYLLMTVNYEGDCQHTCTIAQSGEYMYRKGCQKAYALDGGQTSVLVFNGETFNRVDWDNERSMSDILYFATAVHHEEVSS